MSLCTVISVPSRSMTSQLASSFPAWASHGNPAGFAQISDQTCARIAARARAILSRVLLGQSSSLEAVSFLYQPGVRALPLPGGAGNRAIRT